VFLYINFPHVFNPDTKLGKYFNKSLVNATSYTIPWFFNQSEHIGPGSHVELASGRFPH
jgi:hypothetical protein